MAPGDDRNFIVCMYCNDYGTFAIERFAELFAERFAKRFAEPFFQRVSELF